MALLERLADEVSVAMGRVQIVQNLERRIRDMNALTRVAQGVNITLTFDDVLELIYAQTTQIIPLTHFYIALHDPQSDSYSFAFALENNERVTERENTPLPPNTGLGREVLRRGRPIVTANYELECSAAGLTPATAGIRSWMGVPLNAGAESIGVLSAGQSRAGNHVHPGATRTPAGDRGSDSRRDRQGPPASRNGTPGRAIEQAQRRHPAIGLDPRHGTPSTGDRGWRGRQSWTARQPSSMCRISQPAAWWSTRLPGLSAANWWARARRLVSDTSIELRPRAPRRSRTNSTCPLGRTCWPTAAPAMLPRSSMAVPLQFQDTLVGILEVLNRRDGGPFVAEDEVAPAGIRRAGRRGTENVRLYTLTDQELTARVEELSVMQRIDRELNASLEMDRAMRITLEWALRQTERRGRPDWPAGERSSARRHGAGLRGIPCGIAPISRSPSPSRVTRRPLIPRFRNVSASMLWAPVGSCQGQITRW